MERDDDQDGILTEMTYRGKVVKLVRSQSNDELVRMINTSALTEVELMVSVSDLTVTRLEEAGTLAPFLFAAQLLGVLYIDALELYRS